MPIEWDRSLPKWTSGLRPVHFRVDNDHSSRELSYQRKMKDSPWIQVTINGCSYYGKSLEGEGEYWKKIKTGGKILATGLSFCMVVTIPVLIYMGTHEKIALWVLQIQTNSKLKYKITHHPTISPSSANSSPVHMSQDILGLILKNPTRLDPQEARNYFGSLLSVARNAVPDKEDLRLGLINKGKLKIHEIPELSGEREKIVDYICTHGKKITYLELLQDSRWEWDDQDLEKMIKACPNLKTFIYENGMNTGTTLKGMEEIFKLNQLETLKLAFCPLPTSLEALKNLKELSFNSCSGSVPSLDHLTQLEKLTLHSNVQNYPNLDHLLNLKDLKIEAHSCRIPNLDTLVGLEKLEIWQGDHHPIPSLDALVNLLDLRIGSARSTIPSLKNQEKLRKLEIRANHIVESIELASQAPLQELTLRIKGLKKLPKLDKPETVHSLHLKIDSQIDHFEYIKQFSNLRSLHTSDFPTNLMNHLPLLEDLTACGPSISMLNNMTPQQKRQLKKLNIDSYHESVKIPLFPVENPDPPKLQLFPLDDFVNLEELSTRNIEAKTISLEKNTALRKLLIYRNDSLKYLDHLDKLTKLTHLSIWNCPRVKFDKTSLNALENLTNLSVLGFGHRFQHRNLISERLVRLEKAVFRESYMP